MSWTYIRDAIQAAHKDLGLPDFYKLSDEERERLWSFCEAFAKHYHPETFKCLECGREFPWLVGYRCWDCKTVCCENCIKAHFGQGHQPHPMTLKQFAGPCSMMARARCSLCALAVAGSSIRLA